MKTKPEKKQIIEYCNCDKTEYGPSGAAFVAGLTIAFIISAMLTLPDSSTGPEPMPDYELQQELVKEEFPYCYAVVNVDGGTIDAKQADTYFRIYGEDCWHGNHTYQGRDGDYIRSITIKVQPWPIEDEDSL